jgi:hypothetical protein
MPGAIYVVLDTSFIKVSYFYRHILRYKNAICGIYFFGAFVELKNVFSKF